MEVITFESEAFKALINKLEALEEKILSTATEEWLDNQDVIQMLKISKRSLQTYRDSGKLPYYRIGSKILYRRSEIEASLESYNMVD